jgi:hypothetical protein
MIALTHLLSPASLEGLALRDINHFLSFFLSFFPSFADLHNIHGTANDVEKSLYFCL